jgi:polyisoprenoid-binding protein YceI
MPFSILLLIFALLPGCVTAPLQSRLCNGCRTFAVGFRAATALALWRAGERFPGEHSPENGYAPADTTLALEPSHTEIEFTVGTLLHTVHGTFGLKRGVVHFDPATGAASGELAVDAASGHSGSNGRDKRMGKEILECLSFPEIVFVPDRVEGQFHATAPSQVRLHGQLRIHGAAHEITMQVQTEPNADGLKATATFSVPYVSWGMKNPTTLFLKVNDSVDVTIHAAGHLSMPMP